MTGDPHSVSGRWDEAFHEDSFELWASALRKLLQAPKVSLGTVFIAPRLFEHSASILEIIRLHAQVPLLVGCSSPGLVSGANEVEVNAGLVVGLYYFPETELRAVRFTQAQVEESTGPSYWHHATRTQPEEINGWLVFADPFHLDGDRWLKQWNEAYPDIPMIGGLATGDGSTDRTQLYLNGEIFEEGGLLVALIGKVGILSVISQGCTPIGATWTVTKAERNLIHQIANKPAYEILVETFNGLSGDEQEAVRGNLFVGLVVNEYLEKFERGDFLIRNLLGADPARGTLAVGALPRVGQTIQFQRRDAATANQDMVELLGRAQAQSKGPIYGGILCCCNGRGARLFGTPDHDASLVQSHLGPMGLSGFFCNGEIGPVGDKNFLHGYTASLGVFVNQSR